MTQAENSDVPVYLRLRGLIVDGILDGTHGEGAQLPSVRALASEYGANPLTVARAYQTLQDDDYIVVRRGVGMFVADGAKARLQREERAQFMQVTWPRLRARIERLGIDPRDLLMEQPG